MAILLALILGIGITTVAVRRLSRPEQVVLSLAFAAHFASVWGLRYVGYSVYGVTDSMLYFASGTELASAILADPLRYGPDALSLLAHNKPDLPFQVFGAGSSTGALTAYTAWFLVLFAGSEVAVSAAFAIGSCLGKFLLYRAIRPMLEPERRTIAAMAVCCVPSAVFWSSGVTKESIVFTGMGLAVLGLRRLIHDKRVASWPLAIAGAAVIASTKAYVLFPLALGGALWFVVDRVPNATRRFRFRDMAGATVIGALVVVGLGEVFPRYAVGTFAEEAAFLQELGSRAGGGSYVDIGVADTSFMAQLAGSPFAIVTALFRPFIFEANNWMMVVSAAETSVLLGFSVSAYFRSRGLPNILLERPFLVFLLVSSILLALGVGLTTSNMGTLSRYRTPLVPLFALFLVTVAHRAPRRTRDGAASLIPNLDVTPTVGR